MRFTKSTYQLNIADLGPAVASGFVARHSFR